MYLSISSSNSASTYLSICPCIYLWIYLCIYLPIFLFNLPTNLSVSLCINPSSPLFSSSFVLSFPSLFFLIHNFLAWLPLILFSFLPPLVPFLPSVSVSYFACLTAFLPSFLPSLHSSFLSFNLPFFHRFFAPFFASLTSFLLSLTSFLPCSFLSFTSFHHSPNTLSNPIIWFILLLCSAVLSITIYGASTHYPEVGGAVSYHMHTYRWSYL